MGEETLEQQVGKHQLSLAFNDGMQFEGSRGMLKACLHDIQTETDTSERDAIKSLARYAYDNAERIAKKYGVVDLLDEHYKLYEQFQNLSQ